jgi:hypothetical protein
MESAQALAAKALKHGTTDEERIKFAFRSCVSRNPEPDEVTELKNLLKKEKTYLAEGWVNPSELGTGKTDIPKGLPKNSNPSELAAYTVVSRVLLNLDETITKE